MKVYYQDDAVTLYHGDAFEVMAGMADMSVDAVLTDPPYTDRTHRNAKTNRGGDGVRAVRFAAFTDLDLRDALRESLRVSRGWVVATLAYQHAFAVEESPMENARVLRIGAWVKTNPMPQISADRPAQGWEAIAYLHREDVKPRWSGGGSHGNYVLPVVQNEGHPTTKPVAMFRDFVRRFTDPGGVVLDPFAGSGTTLRAAVDEGRQAIGVEMDERYCEIAAKRLSQGALDLFGAATS